MSLDPFRQVSKKAIKCQINSFIFLILDGVWMSFVIQTKLRLALGFKILIVKSVQEIIPNFPNILAILPITVVC